MPNNHISDVAEVRWLCRGEILTGLNELGIKTTKCTPPSAAQVLDCRKSPPDAFVKRTCMMKDERRRTLNKVG